MFGRKSNKNSSRTSLVLMPCVDYKHSNSLRLGQWMEYELRSNWSWTGWHANSTDWENDSLATAIFGCSAPLRRYKKSSLILALPSTVVSWASEIRNKEIPYAMLRKEMQSRRQSYGSIAIREDHCSGMSPNVAAGNPTASCCLCHCPSSTRTCTIPPSPIQLP